MDGDAAPEAEPPVAAPSAWPLIGAALIALAGLGLFWRQFAVLWFLWSSSDLRSIGALAIPASLIVGARSLSRADFEQGGSWWGLVLVAAAVAGGNLLDYGALRLSWYHGLELNLLPIGLVLYLYGSGVVLMLGGLRAWRKAGFALALLLLTNPVPKFFSDLLDLPLQRLAAAVARSFAALLDVPVSGTALDLMFFHKELGMFIAPGCDGLQGGAAMGLLALVIGRLRGLRPGPHAVFVAAAIALAYLLNLVRLCALVLFYCAAHLMPRLGDHAVGADYAIGAALFMAAAAFLFRAPRGAAARR